LEIETIARRRQFALSRIAGILPLVLATDVYLSLIGAAVFSAGAGGKAGVAPDLPLRLSPRNDAVLSLHEIFGATGRMQPSWHILDENEIEDGIDELGVLIYGHARNAYWYGSQLSIEETRQVAPYQNATGMQVSSAVLAGMVWALESPMKASSKPTKWISGAALRSSCRISAR
jgi:hypothetical protein